MATLISSTAMPQVHVDPTPTCNDGGGNLAKKNKDSIGEMVDSKTAAFASLVLRLDD